MTRRSLGAAASLLVFTTGLQAQTTVVLEAGGSVVEYDGFLVSGAAHASPSFWFDTPNLSVGARGTWVVFESGNRVLQGSAAAAWLTPSHGPWRAEFSGSFGASQYENESGYGHLLGRARIHFAKSNLGAWLSGATGRSFAESSETPFELTVGGWAVQSGISFAGTLTGTWIAGDSYADIVGAARWLDARVEFDAQAGVRTEGSRLGSSLYGQVSAAVALSDMWRITVSGGRTPSDLVRGVVGAKYVLLGVRMQLMGDRTTTPHAVVRAAERAAEELDASPYASPTRLDVVRRGPLGMIHVRASGAESVEIMGDFTDWLPATLVPLDADTWELRVHLSAGVHRLNIRINGGPWLVPAGTRLEETEFGGAVGVIVIP